MDQLLRCPSCHSDKYTSLPFGNLFDASGAAGTYRCLKCCGFFATRAPVHRTPSRRAARTEDAVQAVTLGNLYGSKKAQTRYGLSR